MDKNGDGIMNDGNELFGVDTVLASRARATSGFQALAELDDNSDGKIDATDAAFGKLRVWKTEDIREGAGSEDDWGNLASSGIRQGSYMLLTNWGLSPSVSNILVTPPLTLRVTPERPLGPLRKQTGQSERLPNTRFSEMQHIGLTMNRLTFPKI